jgi:hypothetical protein
MKRFTITTVAVLVIVLAGCSSSPEKRSAEPSGKLVSDPADGDAVIGYLEKREWVITIKEGPRGPVYSVATKSGRIVHENLSAEQLKAQLPELHELIKTGVAEDAGMRSSKFDASVRK